MTTSAPLPYFDHHATTPLDKRVIEAMMPYWTTYFGNASSQVHVHGRKVSAEVASSREAVGDFMGAENPAKEIVFTSGATESNHLALEGLYGKFGHRKNQIISQPTEHSSVIEILNRLQKQGAQIIWLDVNEKGFVDPQQVESIINDKTLAVSVMAVNHEIGTVQPITEIGKIAKKANVVFHCDATQAIGKVPFDVQKSNIDLASFSAHKMYGPKGIGALFVREGIRLSPLFVGGGQEQGLRSGTLNVPGIVGLGRALEISDWQQDAMHISKLREKLWLNLKAHVSEIQCNGPEIQYNGTHISDAFEENAEPIQRHPGNLSVTFKYIDGPALLLALGKKFAVSSGSACSSSQTEPSPVLTAIGLSKEEAKSTLRFGLGRFNTEEEIEQAVQEIAVVVANLRGKSPLWKNRPLIS